MIENPLVTGASTVDLPHIDHGSEAQLPEPASAPSSSVPAPDSSHPLRRTRKIARAERVGGEIALSIDPETLRAVFGIDPTVATRLVSQLVNVIQPDPRKPVDVVSLDQALALIEGISPGDTVEAMTATMLVGAQHAALESLRRASHPDQTPAGRVLYQSLAFKAMRTFAQLLDTLYHGRGRGMTQQIIVKHVTVEAGVQAVLGAIDARTGGGGAPKSGDQSCGAKEQHDRAT
jgi:hypothetical protein